MFECVSGMLGLLSRGGREGRRNESLLQESSFILYVMFEGKEWEEWEEGEDKG